MTGAQLATALADRSVDPLRTVASAGTGYSSGAFVNVGIKFAGGVAADPLAIFNALQTAYGAGKVQTDRDQITPGMLSLTIYP
jgi:hypothetical protein